ncbi:CoA transferase [Cupriavidus basilensis]
MSKLPCIPRRPRRHPRGRSLPHPGWPGSAARSSATHGADVLKIEPPQGDDTRTWGLPFKDGVASYYFGLNRNKRVMRLDLTTDADREVLPRLAGGCRRAGRELQDRHAGKVGPGL